MPKVVYQSVVDSGKNDGKRFYLDSALAWKDSAKGALRYPT